MRFLGVADEPAHACGNDRCQAAFRRVVVQVIDFIRPALWRQNPVRALWHVDGSSYESVRQSMTQKYPRGQARKVTTSDTRALQRMLWNDVEDFPERVE